MLDASRQYQEDTRLEEISSEQFLMTLQYY